MPITSISRCGSGGLTGFALATFLTNPDAMWPLDELTGTTARDILAGHHTAGTAGTTPSWAAIASPVAQFAPRFPQLSGFDTTTVGYLPNLSGDFSAAVWAYKGTDCDRQLYGTQLHGAGGQGWDWDWADSGFAPHNSALMVIGTGGGIAVLPTDGAMGLLTWYWLVITRIAGTFTYYVDAVAQATTYAGAYDAGGPRKVWIGYDSMGFSPIGDIYLSYATLWATRGLSAGEVAGIFAAV